MTLTASEIAEWSRLCGPSFYLLDLDVAVDNYRQLLQAGQSGYAGFGIAYSVKTNYTPALCRALMVEGALMEVVSEMEYELVRKLGQQPKKIIVNGPVHQAHFIERVLMEGALLNLDGFYQLEIVEAFLQKHPAKMFTFGLRIMLDLESCVPSRFGFPAEKNVLSQVAERLQKLPNGRLVSLHCHFCEGARDSTSYEVRAQEMLKIYQAHFQDFPIEVFNLGGGFYSKMPEELKAQFDGPIPEFGVYADALSQPFALAFQEKNRPRLLIEPGNALVADAMQFYTPVLEIKQAGSRTFALVDGSVYDIKPTKNRKNLPLQIIETGNAQHQVKDCNLTGFSCMEDDVLYAGYTGPLATGDYAVFSNCGAYSNVLRPPFIRPSAAIVAHSKGGFFVAKEADTFHSVFSHYELRDEQEEMMD